MDLQAIAETTLQLYKNILEAGPRILDPEPTAEEYQFLFERAHHHYISNLIAAQKGGRSTRPPPARQPYSQQPPAQRQTRQTSTMQCQECGRPLTIKEASYCEQRNEPPVCYHCSHGT